MYLHAPLTSNMLKFFHTWGRNRPFLSTPTQPSYKWTQLIENPWQFIINAIKTFLLLQTVSRIIQKCCSAKLIIILDAACTLLVVDVTKLHASRPWTESSSPSLPRGSKSAVRLCSFATPRVLSYLHSPWPCFSCYNIARFCCVWSMQYGESYCNDWILSFTHVVRFRTHPSKCQSVGRPSS
jgi:hypothetical protein